MVQIVLVDDLSGEVATETVLFGLDGANFEIDLSETNAAAIREALAPYVASARRSGGRRNRRAARRAAGSETAQIRAWAKANGIKVNERGRISADVVEKYRAANS